MSSLYPTVLIGAAKRLSLVEDDNGTLATYSTRASSYGGEGHWCHWVNLARRILAHQRTPENDRRAWGDPQPYDEHFDGCRCGVEELVAELPDLHSPVGVVSQVWDGWWSGDMIGPRPSSPSWSDWVDFANDILMHPATALVPQGGLS